MTSCLGPLCCAMASVVSPGVGIVCNVACLIPPSRVSCYDVIDASITARRRDAMQSETACDVVVVAERAPSVLLGALFG